MKRKIEAVRLLFPYLRRYRWRYVPGALALVANNVAWLAMPLLLKAAVDSLTQTQSLTHEKLMFYAAGADRGRLRQGLLPILDALDLDWHLSRHRVRPAQRPVPPPGAPLARLLPPQPYPATSWRGPPTT